VRELVSGLAGAAAVAGTPLTAQQADTAGAAAPAAKGPGG